MERPSSWGGSCPICSRAAVVPVDAEPALLSRNNMPVPGTSRLVGGTNFAGWDQSADPSFGDADLAAAMDANARRLLRLDRP